MSLAKKCSLGGSKIYFFGFSNIVFIPPGGILFSRCPCVVRPSVTFCFLNILKSHCWNFIKLCIGVGANSIRVISLFPFVVLNGFLYRGLCLCFYSPYTGRSTPTTAFDGTI